MQWRTESFDCDLQAHIPGGSVDILQRSKVFPYHFCHLVDNFFGNIITGDQHIGRADGAYQFGLVRIGAWGKFIPVPKRIFCVDLVQGFLGPVQYRQAVTHQGKSLGY